MRFVRGTVPLPTGVAWSATGRARRAGGRGRTKRVDAWTVFGEGPGVKVVVVGWVTPFLAAGAFDPDHLGMNRRCPASPGLLIRCYFFFQAEDGIRDLTVTGVQTCALPI